VSACPLGCGPLVAAGERLRDNRFGLEGTFQLAWCPVCGLGVTLDPPGPDELERLYGTWYAGEEPLQPPRTGTAARIWHRVNGSLPLADERFAGPVLDVGCNRGELLVALRARGLDGVGIEPNPAAALAARRQGLEVIEAPIESAPLPAGEFGSVVLSQVLEHVHDPAAVLQQVRPSLRPDGSLYVVVPNTASLWRHAFGRDWVHWHVPFHLWHHTRRSLALLLTQNGYGLERARNVTPGEWLLMSIEARRNARRGVYRLEPFRGRYAARLAVAPAARLADAVGRGDALYATAKPS
jgi:SAM-dependent methyltransferase